ncbi:MAG: hypothetical protein IH949_02830, partial [Bacteroidetes bacterium]|nr:hypothetical protein [Bacteroidota bacterium]
MKNLIFFTLTTFLIFGCQKNNSESSDSILNNYYNSSSIPAAIMGTIDVNGKTGWHRFGPSIWDDST